MTNITPYIEQFRFKINSKKKVSSISAVVKLKPLQTPPTQATESIFSVSSGSTMNWHQLERFPFELEMITDEKNTNKLTTVQEFDWVNLQHRRFRTW